MKNSTILSGGWELPGTAHMRSAAIQALAAFKQNQAAKKTWEELLAAMGPEQAAQFERELEWQMGLLEWEKTVPRPDNSPFLTIEKLQYVLAILKGPLRTT